MKVLRSSRSSRIECFALSRRTTCVAAAATTAFGFVARHFIGELGGVAAVFAAIRMAGLDVAGALRVLALFLHMIDLHCFSSLRCRAPRSGREPLRIQAFQ